MNELKEMKVLLIILLTMSIMLNFYLYFLRQPMIKETMTEVIKRDTIINWNYSTDTVFADKIKYKNKIVYDTIVKNNTVYVKDSAVIHRDSTENYTIDISAVKLDWYKLDITHKDTVTYIQTVNNTIYKPKKNKIAIGVQGGYGYGFKSKQLEPYIGLGININLFEK